ncbi:MAG: c-type cytochrome [Terriglobia bacterium]
MKRRGLLVALVVAVLAVGGFGFAFTSFSLTTLNEPSRVETYMATKAKHWLVGRSARGELPPATPNDARSVAYGQMLFGARCASCHGFDARTPTDVGRWMYPRTPDLGSPDVQSWSDAELFWIIKHGVRLTGMPGFGNIHSDEEIWHLVHYLRSLGSEPPDRPAR